MMGSQEKEPLQGESWKLEKYNSLTNEHEESLHHKPEQDGCSARIYPTGFFSNLKDVVKMAVPLILQQLSIYITSPIALMFCGHLGKIALDSVALANSFANVFGISLAVGMGAACDTLFSQVYGSGKTLKMGVVLQRSFCILFLTLLVSISILINIEAISLILGQDPEVSWWTGQYILAFLPGIVFFFGFTCVMKFIQNQNHIVPTLVIGLLANITNVICHYLLIYVAEMDIIGSAIAQSLTYFVMLSLSIIYIIVSGLHKTSWGGWSTESLEAWGQFAYLGISGILMTCIEWWSFEAGIILAGLIGTTELGAQSVVFQIEVVAYMFPLGNGIATSILVGQYLGGSNPAAAKTVARVGITFIFFTGLTMGILLASLREYLPLIFTSEAEVVSLTAYVLPVMGFYMLFDSVSGTCAGILRGSGRQILGAGIVFCGYVIALGIGIPLMFLTSLNILGFWIGLSIALMIVAITESTIVYRMDWEEESKKASKRVGVQESKSSSEEVANFSADEERVSLLQGTLEKEESKVRRDVCRSIFVTLFFIAVFIAAILIRLYFDLPEKAKGLTEPRISHPIINTTMATATISKNYEI